MSRARGSAILAVLLLSFAAGASGGPVVIPNPSYEEGAGKPEGWRLEGGQGSWCEEGHRGKRSISVTGTGEDTNHWRCEEMPLKPNAVYRLRFFTKAEGSGGCIISGSSFVNRDFRAANEWEEKSFIFKTPTELGDGFIRFGQWRMKATVWFDDIEFSKVTPIHLNRYGITLGVGECIDKGIYKFGSQMSKDSSNYSRCCVEHISGFNSNRWTLGDGAEIVYRHEVDGFAQTSGKVALTINYYNSGECIVDAKKDDGAWKEICEFDRNGAHEVALPGELFPARSIEVRLRATGVFQITNYAYEARLDGNPPELRGDTWFIDTTKSSDEVAVEIKSLGTLCPGDDSAVELSFSRTQGAPGELEVQVRMTPQEGAEMTARKAVSLADRAEVRIPYAVKSAGRYGLTLSILDRGSGAIVFEAHSSFFVPSLYAADFGYLLDGNDSWEMWWCGPTHKVSRERPVPSERSDLIEITAAKGEYEPFQLVIRPKRDLRNVHIRIGAFRDRNGRTIPPENIKADVVAYVPVTIPTDALGCVGDWPDPLPPYEGPFDVGAEKNQPIWITFKIPRDAAAGDYRGVIEVAPEGAPTVSARVKVRVYDFEIPQETHLQVGMNMSKGPLRRYHNLETPEEVEQVFYLYNKNMSEHRVANFGIMSYYRPEITFTGANWRGGEKVDEEQFTGKRSLLAVDDDPARAVTVSAIEFLPVRHGERYEFSWAAKTEADHPYVVSLNQYDADKRWISGNNIDLRCKGTGEWQKETHRVGDRITPHTKYVLIHLRPTLWTPKGEHTGKAYFDEIIFRKLLDGENMVTDSGFESGAEDIGMKIDFTRFDEAGKKYLDGLGFNVFKIPLYGFGGGTFHSSRYGKILNYDQGTPEYMALFSKYCRALVDHLIEKGWYEKSCVYWFDEPAPKDYPFVREGMECLRRAEPRLKRMLTEQPEEELFGFVDIWLPVLSRYDRERAWARQAKGEEIWWYICCGPKTPYPNNFIDHPAIEPRIWLWMTWQNRVTGCHIWTINYWNGPLVYPAPDIQNPYEDPMSYVSGYGHEVGFVGYWGNGDGRSIYPPNRDPRNDKRKYICGPVNSIRWELIREGIEDYHYFWLLNERVKALEGAGGHEKTVREAKALLSVPEEIIRGLTDFTKNPALLQRHRERVARMLEQVNGLLRR